MDAAARPTSEYELLPPQGNAQHATGGAAYTTGSQNENAEASSRRSSLSASSGEFEYMAAGGISMLPDTHYGPGFGISIISPASSIRSSSRRHSLQEDDVPEENALSSSEYRDDDDYVSVSRASSDVGVYPTVDGIRRSLEEAVAAAEGQQSAETLVEGRSGMVPQVDDEVVVAEKDGGGVVVVGTPRPWTPFYLRRMTLLGFALVYVMLLVALVVLGAFDQRNQGLATSKSSRHYLWTYGPTAGACAS